MNAQPTDDDDDADESEDIPARDTPPAPEATGSRETPEPTMNEEFMKTEESSHGPNLRHRV